MTRGEPVTDRGAAHVEFGFHGTFREVEPPSRIVHMEYGARDAAISTGMTDGMELSYQLLDRRLAEQGRPAR